MMHLLKGKNAPIIGLVLAAVVLMGLSPVMSLGLKNQFTSLMLIMLLAISWNLVGGFAGQFSLGHSVFVGFGAYSMVLMLDMAGLPFLLSIVLAAAVSAGIGVLLAYPLLRLRGPYLAVGSLGIALASYGWMINWEFTRKSSSYPVPKAGLVSLDSLYVITVVVAAVAILVSILFVRSPLGLRLVALRENELGAQSLGVRRVRTVLPVWAISGFLAGLMGALYTLQQGSVTVDATFLPDMVLTAIVVSVLGGLGTLSGPIIGAIIVFYVRFYAAGLSELAFVIEAVVVILVVRFFPGGVVGIVSRALARRKQRKSLAA